MGGYDALRIEQVLWLSAGNRYIRSGGDGGWNENESIRRYGAQSAEEKRRIFKLMRNLNFKGEYVHEPFSPTTQGSGGIGASDGFYSPETIRGDFGAGLLDLHDMDDTELLTEEDTPVAPKKRNIEDGPTTKTYVVSENDMTVTFLKKNLCLKQKKRT